MAKLSKVSSGFSDMGVSSSSGLVEFLGVLSEVLDVVAESLDGSLVGTLVVSVSVFVRIPL